MKQRLFNNFNKIFRIRFLAYIATYMLYSGLLFCYIIKRYFIMRSTSRLSSDEALKIVNFVRGKNSNQAIPINNTSDTSCDLSIIIPVYNVEKYLNECLDSIIYQKTHYKIEIIIVNDGSTDSSEKIIQRYRDDRIVYIKQENQGLSGARNTGINIAKGKYLLFVDSDDVLTEKSIDTLLDNAYKEGADIVIGSFYTFSEESKSSCIASRKIIENNPEIAVNNMGFAWGKICKREMFEKLRFPLGTLYEDTIVCMVLYRMCKKMVVLDDIVCGYRSNPSGISKNSRKSNKSLDHIWVMYDAVEQAHQNGLKDDQLQYNMVRGHFSNLMRHRLFNIDDFLLEAAFVLACDLLEQIRPITYLEPKGFIQKDLDLAFKTKNYKLWKSASLIE